MSMCLLSFVLIFASHTFSLYSRISKKTPCIQASNNFTTMHISLRQKIDYSQWFFWQILHSEKNIEAAHTHWDKIMIFLSTWKIRQIVTFINYIVPNQVNLTNYFQIAISLEKFVKLQHTLTKKCKTKSI